MPNKTPIADSYQGGDILVPLCDAWDAQSLIYVINEHGSLRFHQSGPDEFYALLDKAPDPATVYQRPRRGTPDDAVLQKVENIVAHAIEAKGTLKLEASCKSFEALVASPPAAEKILRYLVARGDLIAGVKTGRKKTVISLKLSAGARAREGHRSYASSFAHELALQSEHLGNLIGHGPTIGGQREELLRALIERHVPTRFHVATGFVEGSDRQVDILIYDQVEFAPLFRAGNLVVVPPEAVRALIEVKSTLNSGDLEDALTHLEEAVGHRNSGPPIFRGIFAYKGATTQTLIDLMIEHYREPTDFDDNFGKAVFSIYEMATAVCILRKSLLVTGFCHRNHKGASQRAPALMELASEAGRETQAALFFDMLSRFLRHPFSGTQSQRSLANRFAADIAQRNIQQLYPGRYWGPYLIDSGIDRVEAQVSAFESWLQGGAWNEPAPDPEYS